MQEFNVLVMPAISSMKLMEGDVMVMLKYLISRPSTYIRISFVSQISTNAMLIMNANKFVPIYPDHLSAAVIPDYKSIRQTTRNVLVSKTD